MCQSTKLGLLLCLVGVLNGEIDEFACWPSSRPDVEELRESCCDVSRSSEKILAQSSCFTGIHTYEILGLESSRNSQMRDFFFPWDQRDIINPISPPDLGAVFWSGEWYGRMGGVPPSKGRGHWNFQIDQTTKIWNKISWEKRIKRVC